MADRRVTGTDKPPDGDITALCGTWDSVTKAEAIDQIDNGTHMYFVMMIDGSRVRVVVVNDRSGRHLRTDPDETLRNNLSDLPRCSIFAGASRTAVP